MKTAIVIGMIGLALVSSRAAAQTAVERAQILRDFQTSVVDYTQQHQCLAMFPEAGHAASPAARVFTLPVAMVFRQLIGETVLAHHGGDITKAIIETLPALPATLQYRLIETDLEIRDTEGAVVAVLKDAYGAITLRH